MEYDRHFKFLFSTPALSPTGIGPSGNGSVLARPNGFEPGSTKRGYTNRNSPRSLPTHRAWCWAAIEQIPTWRPNTCWPNQRIEPAQRAPARGPRRVKEILQCYLKAWRADAPTGIVACHKPWRPDCGDVSHPLADRLLQARRSGLSTQAASQRSAGFFARVATGACGLARPAGAPGARCHSDRNISCGRHLSSSIPGVERSWRGDDHVAQA